MLFDWEAQDSAGEAGHGHRLAQVAAGGAVVLRRGPASRQMWTCCMQQPAETQSPVAMELQALLCASGPSWPDTPPLDQP